MHIEEWTPAHLHWVEAAALIESLGQMKWVSFTAEWHVSTHVLVALMDGAPAGMLRFVVQPIGPDAGCEPVAMNGKPLIEAKVLAFGVLESCRRKGIGRALQLKLIERARALGCYQVRSHSGGDHPENHHLKLSLGYAVQPIVRGDDTRGAYFILPLRAQEPM
jgi:GNAT superfamily N-acetyltransferase